MKKMTADQVVKKFGISKGWLYRKSVVEGVDIGKEFAMIRKRRYAVYDPEKVSAAIKFKPSYPGMMCKADVMKKYNVSSAWLIRRKGKVGRVMIKGVAYFEIAKIEKMIRTRGKHAERKQPPRYPDCMSYSRCLESAAIENSRVACDGCGDYVREERML